MGTDALIDGCQLGKGFRESFEISVSLGNGGEKGRIPLDIGDIEKTAAGLEISLEGVSEKGGLRRFRGKGGGKDSFLDRHLPVVGEPVPDRLHRKSPVGVEKKGRQIIKGRSQQKILEIDQTQFSVVSYHEVAGVVVPVNRNRRGIARKEVRFPIEVLLDPGKGSCGSSPQTVLDEMFELPPDQLPAKGSPGEPGQPFLPGELLETDQKRDDLPG